MKYSIATLAALAMFAVASQASANFSGSYTVRFRIGPSHEKVNRQCVIFTQTGGVNGFPDSGSWTSPTDPGWSGYFIVDGKDLRFYGTFGNGGVDDMHVRMENGAPHTFGGFDEWLWGRPPVPMEDGIFHMKAGCRGQVGNNHGPSPTGH